jgi:outer membrane lipoprotein-sorting protein
MRHLGFICCAVMLSGATASSPADEPARLVLNKAIEAQGGAAALARFKGFAYSESGTRFAPDGTAQAATAKVAFQLPDKFRYEGRTPDGKPLVQVFDGEHAWIRMGDRTEETKPDRLAATKELMYLLQVTSLVPLRDPAYTLTDLGDSTVQDRKVSGIKVARAGHPDVNLYFDRESSLLYRLTTRETDPQSGGQQDREEVTWDYRDVGGVKMSMYFKVWTNHKPRVEMKLTDVKCAEKLDDHLFAKP